MCEDDRPAIVAQIKGVDEAVMSIDDDKTVCKTLDLTSPIFLLMGAIEVIQKFQNLKFAKKMALKLLMVWVITDLLQNLRVLNEFI